MENDRIYDAWAPTASPWAAWAKPVLFAHWPSSGDAGDPVAAPDLSSLPASDGATAVVVDLPGRLGVATAIALARSGYRPVPLYNAMPAPPGVVAAVSVWPIVAALTVAAIELRAVPLPADAPPAFLLDSGRQFAQAGVGLAPGVFDNRSVSLPADFPSAGRLQASGVRRILLVTATATPPQTDLAHTLCRWQEGGLPILSYAVDQPSRPPVAITVARPGGFRSMWHGLIAMVGLRRHPLGGFGGTLPIPSAG